MFKKKRGEKNVFHVIGNWIWGWISDDLTHSKVAKFVCFEGKSGERKDGYFLKKYLKVFFVQNSYFNSI